MLPCLGRLSLRRPARPERTGDEAGLFEVVTPDEANVQTPDEDEEEDWEAVSDGTFKRFEE